MFQNSATIFKQMYGDKNLNVIPRLSKGDRVRLLIEKKLFDKQNLTEEIYKISSVFQRSGIV